ncbi:TPA: Opacity protein opA54, partial [Neisseria gonorrhoeae]
MHTADKKLLFSSLLFSSLLFSSAARAAGEDHG